jgi:trimeric autotransporter adhesin
MKGKRIFGIGLIMMLMLTLVVGLALAQEPSGSPLFPAFTYQGRLNSEGVAYSGACDFQFSLWDALTGGIQIGLTQTVTNVGLVDGYFTVQLDFGPTFQGEARWLGIYVRCPAGSGTYTQLTPRQALTATPYALYALNSWQINGNQGTAPGFNYIGTNDNQPLLFKVNGERALRLEPNATSPNVIGGYVQNYATSGVAGAVIGGGGASAAPNFITDSYGTVSGGLGNLVGDAGGAIDDANYATVGGGSYNAATATYATIGGGHLNVASSGQATVCGGYGNTASAEDATVGGGWVNTASGDDATIAGGWFCQASGDWAFVGGGAENIASGIFSTITGGESNSASSLHATVGGGYTNTANGSESTVGGGQENSATGIAATVPGGVLNVAQGNYSFAAGRNAKAYYEGCFVWGDSTNAHITCDNANRWVARASGGVYFYTDSGLTSGMYLAAGGSAWNAVSNPALKEHFSAIDTQALVENLAGIPITTWNYKSQDENIRHIGPMADDLNALLPGLGGEGEMYINSLDADGIALASIQGLHALSEEQRAQIDALVNENAVLKAQLSDLEARMAALEQGSSNGTAQSYKTWLTQGPWLLLVGLVSIVAFGRRRKANQ